MALAAYFQNRKDEMMQDWKPCKLPALPTTEGRFVRISRLDPEADGPDLFLAVAGPGNDTLWQYIPFGPPASTEELLATLEAMATSMGWQTLVIREVHSGKMLGMASYMRIRADVGSAEIGCVIFSKALQKTAAATEALFIMARHLFDDLGYRRFEWKCDNNNSASIRAAFRFGFSAEGVFRQDLVVKGRNRDTAWFSMIDSEWPTIRGAFERWLDPGNFNTQGSQITPLSSIREQLL